MSFLYEKVIDVLIFSWIRKSETLMKLLKILAYKIGQGVPYASIAKDFCMSLATIGNYVDILEKAFIDLIIGKGWKLVGYGMKWKSEK